MRSTGAYGNPLPNGHHNVPRLALRTRLVSSQNGSTAHLSTMTRSATPSSGTRAVVRPVDCTIDLHSTTAGGIPAWPDFQLYEGVRCRIISAYWDKVQLRVTRDSGTGQTGPSDNAAQQQASRLVMLHGEHNFVTIDFGGLYAAPRELSRRAPEYVQKVGWCTGG